MMLARLRKASLPVTCATIASFVASMLPRQAWAQATESDAPPQTVYWSEGLEPGYAPDGLDESTVVESGSEVRGRAQEWLLSQGAGANDGADDR